MALNDVAQRVRGLVGQSSQAQLIALLDLRDAAGAVPIARVAIGRLLEGGGFHVPGELENLARYLGELHDIDAVQRMQTPSASSTAPAVPVLPSYWDPHMSYKHNLMAYFLKDPSATISGATRLAELGGSADPRLTARRAMSELNFGVTPEFRREILAILFSSASDAAHAGIYSDRELSSSISGASKDAPYNLRAATAIISAGQKCLQEEGADPGALCIGDLLKKVAPCDVPGVRVFLERPRGFALPATSPYVPLAGMDVSNDEFLRKPLAEMSGAKRSASERRSHDPGDDLPVKRPRTEGPEGGLVRDSTGKASDHDRVPIDADVRQMAMSGRFAQHSLPTSTVSSVMEARGVPALSAAASWPDPDSSEFDAEAWYDAHIQTREAVPKAEEVDRRFDFLPDRPTLSTFPFADTARGSTAPRDGDGAPRVLPFGQWEGWSLDAADRSDAGDSLKPTPVHPTGATQTVDGAENLLCLPVSPEAITAPDDIHAVPGRIFE